MGLLSGPSAAEFWVRPGPELQALHTVFGAQESVAPGRHAPAWRLGTGSLQSDHSRPQGEVVGTSGTRRGAGCELSADQQHLSRRSARARDPAPLWVLTQTPWGPGDRRLWGVARHSRGGPAVPTTYPWRPQCHLPSQHSPPHPQSHSPAGHPWGCHQQGTARPAAAHPPGMPLLQGCALGFRRVLDHSSGLPREVHGHQGVLRHTALEGQSHERVKPSDQAAAAAGHLGAKRKAFLCRT